MLTHLATLPVVGGVVGGGVAGVLAALGYFGGLWWTIRQLPGTAHPWWLYASSVGLRLVGVLSVFYGLLVGWGGFAFAAGCLSFFVTRVVMTRCLQPRLPEEPATRKAG